MHSLTALSVRASKKTADLLLLQELQPGDGTSSERHPLGARGLFFSATMSSFDSTATGQSSRCCPNPDFATFDELITDVE